MRSQNGLLPWDSCPTCKVSDFFSVQNTHTRLYQQKSLLNPLSCYYTYSLRHGSHSRAP